MFAVGRAKETRAAWETVLRIAEERNEESHRLRALWGLWIGRLNNGDFAGALESAQAFAQRVAGSSDIIDVMMADRMLGTSLHYLGDQLRARVHIEDAIRHYDLLERQRLVARFQFDQRVTARYFQARILWLLGYPDQARQIAEANIAEAETIGHALSFGSVLGQGVCPVALLTGDLVAARRYGQMLLDHAELHGLRLWRDWAWCFNRLIEARQGDMQALQETRNTLEHAGDAVALPRYLILIAELAARLGDAGKIESAMRMIDGTIARCERARERWYEPELLRMKAELLFLKDGRSAAVAADAILSKALRLAEIQGARSWELRIATSLFRLRSGQARRNRAEKLLSTTLAWFAEGHDTVDLQLAARALAGSMT